MVGKPVIPYLFEIKYQKNAKKGTAKETSLFVLLSMKILCSISCRRIRLVII